MARPGLLPFDAAKESTVDEENWPLTSRAIEASERAAGLSEDDLADDEEPVLGNSVLHALAEQGLIEEYEPGRFYVSKLEES
jgi:hypothetical protein